MFRAVRENERTCHEASDNKFNRQHLTLFHDGDVWVWNGKQSIWDDMLCMLHPPCACLIQDLALHQCVINGKYAASFALCP